MLCRAVAADGHATALVAQAVREVSTTELRRETRGDTVSESENLPERCEAELAIESFVDKIKEIHPDLDREEFHNAISGYVQQAATEEDGGDGP